MDYHRLSIIALFIRLSCLVEAQFKNEDDLPVINTSYGPIRGQKFISSWTKKTIYSFRGIPYASPPIGKLRFKDPIPPEKWTTIRDCTKEQPICPQKPSFPSKSLVTNEDCLFLNVYSPLIQRQLELLPVIVWIHGGSFLEGSGNYDLNAPDLLVGEGVVVVTINYRLGALGFMTLSTPDIPGNAGLKDQRLALKWVQSEIRQFGGDPQKVTLFGESAGSVAVHMQYLSPHSTGLFHRVIGDSGSALAYRVRDNGRYYGLLLAQELNCPTDNILSAQKCLMEADAEDITTAQVSIKAPQDDKTGLTVFCPTIDKDTSKEPILPDFPINLVKQKKGSFVPFLMGINSQEGILRLFRSEEEIRNITNNLGYVYALQLPNNCSEKLRAEEIKQFYFKDTKPSDINVKGYVDLYTDTLYAYATIVSARTYQERGNVFLYYFSFDGKFKNKIVYDIEKKYNISGVCHGEELHYLFVTQGMNQTITSDSDDVKTWRRMVKMWTNFAKYGKPTVGPDPQLQNINWLPLKGGRTYYLHIDVDLKMTSSDLLSSRAALWDSVTFNHCSKNGVN